VITRQGSGANEVIIKDNGDVFINNGTVQVTSSRAAKENFEALDPEDVLDSLRRLPVTAWNYKKDDASVRHVGPTSEDFQLAFSLGSDAQHLSPTDVSGVTLVAVQGLQRVIEEKERRIGSLEERLQRLEEILEAQGENCAGNEGRSEDALKGRL
jgi:hypothetical protein